MSSTSKGRDAEEYVARTLTKQGYKLVAQNWRTRWCEVDLIMTKNATVYFIEVKYRESMQWGSGLEYITNKKQKQMQFAAELWLAQNKWESGAELCAVEVRPETSEVELVSLF